MHAFRLPALWLACAAQFLVLLDFSASNVFAPAIVTDIGLATAGGFWLMGAFALPYGAFLLVGGRLTDACGAVNTMLGGIALLVGGNLLCAAAERPAAFLAARAVQGVAAAIVTPSSLAAVMRLGEGQQDRALSLYGAVTSLGFSAGLVVGGVLGQYVGWRAFFVAGVAASLLLFLLLSGLRERGAARWPSLAEFAPLAAASLLVALFVVGLSLLSATPPQGTLAVATLALASFGLVVLWRMGVSGDLRQVRQMLRRPGFALLLLCFALVGGALAPMLVMLSLYQALALGQNTLGIALAFLPHGLACAGVGLLLPRLLERFGPSRTGFASLGCFVAGLAWFGLLRPGAAYAAVLLPGLLLTAFGIVGSFVCILVLANTLMPPQEQGMVSALLNVADQIGASLGLALMALVVSVFAPGAGVAAYPPVLMLLAGAPLGAALLLRRARAPQESPQ